MNTEYMKLSNGNTIVTDENGHIIERKDAINKDLLILENKLEIINDESVEINREISEQKKVTKLAKLMLLGFPIVLLGIDAIVFVTGGITGDGSFIEAGCQAVSHALVADAITLSVLVPYFSLGLPISNKKTKKLERKMQKANELCKQYEKELEKVKEDIKEENITIEPISLVHESMVEESEIEEQLQKAYSPKKRVLRK